MPSVSDRGSGKLYWRSLDELADSPEFRAVVEHEFPYLSDTMSSSSTRRGFLKLMGASLGLAGLAGCRWPREEIVEYARRPSGRTPGTPVSYATTRELNGISTGLLITSYDGRPIKVEGNPLHPFSLGATDFQMQAAILEIYDPDRSMFPRHGKPGANLHGANPAQAWAGFDKAVSELATASKAKSGNGLCILSEPVGSPTLSAMRTRLMAALPQAAWFEYSPAPLDSESNGLATAFGSPHRAMFDLTKASVIVSFGCDFQLTHPASLRYSRDYARGRSAANGELSRLYVVESNMSLTGSNADQRYAERNSDIAARLCQLAAALVHVGVALPAAAQAAGGKLGALGEKAPGYIAELAADLVAHKGKSLICVGANQPAEAHALAALLNFALENHGKTVSYLKIDVAKSTGADAIAGLVERIGSGGVETLVILGGNPVYDAPADLGFGAALAKVKSSIHLSLFEDETSRECTWHVPAAHWLEAWGDGRAWDGSVSVQQPLVAPLYDGRSAIELVASLAGESAIGYDLVRKTLKERFAGSGDFEAEWRNALHDGIVPNTKIAAEAPAISSSDWTTVVDGLAKSASAAGGGTFEIVFEPDRKMFDGRYVNNGWLQELPDPITKLTWDNAAYMSPVDAANLGVRRDSIIDISFGGKTLTIPVCVVPGHAKGSITLPLGYGREFAGIVAKGTGVNVNALRTRAAFTSASGATVRASGGSRRLATTQDHHAMDSDVTRKEVQRRVPELVREGTLTEYTKNPRFAASRAHQLPLVQLFGDHQYPDKPRWAMAIDLSKCTGCSSCVVACQSENNIPVVGKEEVILGREMHWLRIDRYFLGDPMSDVQVVHQPVPCQQCENAPCEQVCPVAATTHDEQGLNVMIYNRCIGTRYCSNNCPYKVRRFNWFYNQHGPRHPRSKDNGVTVFQTYDIKNTPSMLPQKKLTDIERMGKNPDVTVRSRGVMEKCTFCVQRLTRARVTARNDQLNPVLGPAAGDRPLDGAVTTACAQACPAEAITFGDLNLKTAKIHEGWNHDRSYTLLEELNVRPRVKYLAKLRNPAKEPAHVEPSGHGGGGHA